MRGAKPRLHQELSQAVWVTTARPNPLEARAGPLAELRGSWFPFPAGALGIWEPQLLLLVLSYGECQSTACRWLWCSCGEEEEDASPRLGAGTSPAVTHTALGAGVELKPANQLFFFFFGSPHLVYQQALQGGCGTAPSTEGARPAGSRVRMALGRSSYGEKGTPPVPSLPNTSLLTWHPLRCSTPWPRCPQTAPRR